MSDFETKRLKICGSKSTMTYQEILLVIHLSLRHQCLIGYGLGLCQLQMKFRVSDLSLDNKFVEANFEFEHLTSFDSPFSRVLESIMVKSDQGTVAV